MVEKRKVMNLKELNGIRIEVNKEEEWKGFVLKRADRELKGIELEKQSSEKN